MSTRSGKRIHGSLHENTVKPDVELVPKSERKTRSRQKENIDDQQTVLQKFKKRENYVSYPTDDEQAGDMGNLNENEGNTRTLRKNALKEHNPVIVTEISDEPPPKSVRSTRRTRKFAENITETAENVEVQITEAPVTKTKKSKRKKTSSEGHGETEKPKKKNKKRKGKRSNSFITENIEEVVVDNVVNKSNISNDSFHSAAGSPTKQDNAEKELPAPEDAGSIENEPILSNKKAKKSKSFNKSIEKSNSIIEESSSSIIKNDTFEIEPRKRKSSIKNTSIEDISNVVMKNKLSNGNISMNKDDDTNMSQIKNNTYDIEPQRKSLKTESPIKINATFDKNTSLELNSSKPQRQSIKNDSSIKINTTFEKNTSLELNSLKPQRHSIKNESPIKINTTFEKNTSLDSDSSKSRKRKSTIDIVDSPVDIITAFDVSKQMNTQSPLLNSTYDKSDTSAKVNTTFELDKNNLNSPNKIKQSTIINTTFEKETESPKTKKRRSGSFVINSERKSMEISKNNNLASSLNTAFGFKNNSMEKLSDYLNKGNQLNATFEKDLKLNTTFDKLSKSSLISSDSNSEDISRISITSDESITEPKPKPGKEITIMNETPVLIDSSADSLISEDISDEVTEPTPLRREGTFTKDGPDDPNKSDESPIVTPKKNMSMPSPGSTPFPTRSLTKEKPLLNVTRSIEKSRKSSGVEPAPRITRVMFCSPVNNPVIVAQQKRMVIKSNLKGSNKSFVYEESESISAHKPGPRKRSHTHSEAEATRAKRTRLTDDQRQSADRLSRHRTSSASGKLTDISTPSKKATPSKAKVPRTKLPNFAALHQKQFDKMESLDECQERKAKRARQLLTPVANTSLHDKSPKVATETQKDQPKKEIKKAETPVKTFTQEASKPAYTRFGFKLNLDVNPFSIPSKTVVKPKDNPYKLPRQATLPSLTGATSMRREVAKQVVMREKSFTDKRQLKRNENRTIIKGVRTNRRFELQMKLRNIE